jgi:hypothetical protein
MADFLPRRQADLRTWSATFKQAIQSDAAAYGPPAAPAPDTAAAHDSAVALLALSEANDTRTPTVILRKDEAFAALAAEARKLARVARAWPATSPEKLSTLGLAPRGGDGPADASQLEAPVLIVNATHGRTATIQLLGPTQNGRKGKPAGAVGAAVYVATGGDEAPSSIADFTFLCNTTNPVTDVALGAGLPSGTRVWLTACWLDSRLQPSRAATPRDTYIGFGLGAEMTSLRAAA